MSTLQGLQDWYALQCNGDWEHQKGLCIDTLDNPGWSLKVCILGTYLEHLPFSEIKIDRSDADWIFARRNLEAFEAFGGVHNLEEMISIFLDWADKSN